MLVIFGGVLLLTPGFITDIFGLAFLFPPTRVVLRRLLVRRGALKLVGSMPGAAEPAERERPAARHRGQRRRHRSAAAMSAIEMETPRALRKPGDTDAVTFSWADAGAGLYGLARVASGLGADGAVSSSALAVGSPGATRWARSPARRADDVVATTDAPLERWTVRGSGELAFALVFEALTPPVAYGGRQARRQGGRDGGLRAALPRAPGRWTTGRSHGLGQRGHSWGNPDWDKIALTRIRRRVVRRRERDRARARPRREGDQPRRRGRVGRVVLGGALDRGRRRAAVDHDRRRAGASSVPASSCGWTRTTSTRTAGPARS